jgi:hypothetical protein
MNTYITEIEAIDPTDGELKRWEGIKVESITPELAQQWCNTNGYGYCKVVGQLRFEIDQTNKITNYEYPNKN